MNLVSPLLPTMHLAQHVQARGVRTSKCRTLSANSFLHDPLASLVLRLLVCKIEEFDKQEGASETAP